ncbi:MAG: acyl-CoA dehydrogenase C-terminal domain-containing protein [Rhodospirillales bacterium]|nr:acyl-CoA dehydrogenase C-terminal domain-containing protein [Rhodospirillales bacterium]MCB9965388.1 acyl-CoA dehydrogenase C-terminal domain-containing protein [Rhodospirillales bacterium]MCB9973283.1 acyl-CoA dehydrogenase C-terminal domain-containing protein [Rhodospirillales bacterium]MCB9980605.1 acyl-CoA dehydrogenase C-terminal domain-containing protein [Rhodospirillales bacterium]
MPLYNVPLDDIRFVLHEVLDVEKTLSDIPAYEETSSADLMDQVLEEGAKICQDVLFPLNMSGDHEGCTFEKGVVRTPKGFQEAYALFSTGGWCGVSADPEYGGMGLPAVMNASMQEMLTSSNMSFGMYPGLSQGAYEAISHFGTDVQKQTYLPHLADGSWSGTMNLTEPHCGTDLGLIKTKAIPNKDGSYAVSGQKIFISAGEHDLTENIVHLVLARLPDAPEGVKGISLFIVPKFLPETGARNDGVFCASIEEKMGIHANATCVMVYENAVGWLLGEPHKGLKAMFTMMNAARLGVAMQGLGIAEVACQNAVAYAKDRLQMRSLSGIKAPDKPADPIIVHPDIRRMLLKSKAFCEGARALAYWAGVTLDLANKHPDKTTRAEADDLVALMTPILKAYLTDMGSEIANEAIQVYGGAGFIREHGIEQYARDARIAMIYEGTNGIQALDLVGRKMSLGYGRLLRQFFHPVMAFIEENQMNASLQEFIFPLAKAFGKLQQSTALIAQRGLKDPEEAAAASVDYLRQFALVAMAYMWAKMAGVAQEKLAEGTGNKDFYEEKLHIARFFFARMLPEADARFKMVLAGAAPLMAMKAESF